MSLPPTYQQSVKDLSRVRLWSQAVAQLTTRREDSRIITDDYMRNLWEYAKNELQRFATLDDTVLNQWRTYARSCYGTKTPADLKIAYLSGPEPENDLTVLLDLGIDIANVWAFEQEASLYKAALAKAHALHPSLKVYPGKIETFTASSNMRFDIIYLDFTGALFSAASKPFRALHGILENHALSTLGVLIVNSAEPEQTPDSVDLLARYFQNQLWVEATVYGEKRANGSPIEHYVEGPDSYGFELQKLKSLVEDNFGAAYSAFATQYPALYANYVQPALSVMSDTVAKKRFFNPDQKAMDAEIDRFSNADAFLFNFFGEQTSADIDTEKGAVKLGSDLLLSPYDYPLQHFLLGLSENNGKDARSLLGFYIEKENGVSRSRALSAFDVLRSILEGYWAVLSPELATTLKEVYRTLPDRNGGLFCDVPMIHLWAEAALYQLGFPYHVNTRHHWRATYKAKARRMYIDSFVLDQCRSFYDRMPMIELYGKVLSKFDMQVMSRICIDAICKARGEMVPQLYSGGNLICFYKEKWATQVHLKPRENLDKETV